MKKSTYQRKCTDTYNRKPVLQFNLHNIFIKEWKTVGEIHRELGLDKSAVLRCCKGKQKKSYHFIWKFKEDVSLKTMEEIKHGSDSEKVSEVFLETKSKD